MPFRFKQTDLPGVWLIEPRVCGDQRAVSLRLTRSQSSPPLASMLASCRRITQSRLANLARAPLPVHPSRTRKLVRAIVGEVFDVAVDVRRNAVTYGKWVGVNLSAANHRLIYIPPWCAHGFCVMSDYAEVVYKTTVEYAPQHEHGISWDDPALGISWPISEPRLSERDRCWPVLSDTEAVFV